MREAKEMEKQAVLVIDDTVDRLYYGLHPSITPSVDTIIHKNLWNIERTLDLSNIPVPEFDLILMGISPEDRYIEIDDVRSHGIVHYHLFREFPCSINNLGGKLAESNAVLVISNNEESADYFGDALMRTNYTIHDIREMYFDFLLREYGELAGISKKTLPNGQVKYRRKVVEGTPGIWISQKKAETALWQMKELGYYYWNRRKTLGKIKPQD